MINPQLERKLNAILGKGRVSTGFAETLVYQSDGLTLHKAQPGCVVFPESTAEVQSVVLACLAADTPYVARGAGTGLSGGAVMDGGVIVELSRMNRIIAIHPEDRYAVVQPGVVNNHLSIAAKPYGMEFAPDPSSQMVCTIGGNVAENAGGPHTLKYGVTTNHVLGQTAVLGDGELVKTGGPWPVQRGSSFSSFLVGTEGTVAITTEIIVRLMPTEPGVKTMLAVFDSIAAATDSVTAILSAGVLTSALELMDSHIIKAVEAHPSPAVAGRRIRLRYMTQANARPPTFVVFCSRPKALPDSYSRYLVNSLRENFDLPGVPIRLHLRKGRNPYERGA